MKPVPVLALLAALCAGGCATPAPAPSPDAACRADAAQPLVGQPATPANAELARQRAGAAVVRVLRPGQMVTLEYRGDRLNVHADAADRIERITCG